MTRAGALAFRRSSSNEVSRNGARWLTAQVSSMRSWLSCRGPYMAPALLTSTSSLGQRASTSAASLRTAACDDRSATKIVTVAALAAAPIAAAAARVLVSLRPTMTTLAPSTARACAAARPMPLVAPVIGSCVPCTRSPKAMLLTLRGLPLDGATDRRKLLRRRRAHRDSAHGLHEIAARARGDRGRATLVEAAAISELALVVISEEIRRADRTVGSRHRLVVVMQVRKRESRAFWRNAACCRRSPRDRLWHRWSRSPRSRCPRPSVAWHRLRGGR